MSQGAGRDPLFEPLASWAQLSSPQYSPSLSKELLFGFEVDVIEGKGYVEAGRENLQPTLVPGNPP